MPTNAAAIRREHVETFIEHLLERWKPATANNRYRALARLFDYLVEEGELAESPMARMTPPRVPEQLVPVLSEDHLRALLKECDGKTLEERRDMAIIRLFIDTGMRLGELTGLTLTDLDLDQETSGVARPCGRPSPALAGPGLRRSRAPGRKRPT